MSRSITTSIKSFRPQRTGNRSTSAEHRGICKHRSNSSTSSDTINILAYIPPVSDSDWYLYYEDDYSGKIYALDIHIVYMDETNRAASNTSY